MNLILNFCNIHLVDVIALPAFDNKARSLNFISKINNSKNKILNFLFMLSILIQKFLYLVSQAAQMAFFLYLPYCLYCKQLIHWLSVNPYQSILTDRYIAICGIFYHYNNLSLLSYNS